MRSQLALAKVMFGDVASRKAKKDLELPPISADRVNMKITQSDLTLQSQHASASLRTQQSTLRAWVGDKRPDFERDSRERRSGVTVSLSDVARAAARQDQRSQWRAMAQAQASAPAPEVQAGRAVEKSKDTARNDPRLSMLIEMVENITGRAVQVFDASELQADAPALQGPPIASATPSSSSPPPPAAGWGVEIDAHEIVAETETMQMQAQGVVRTADGLEIQFELKLEMSRQFVQETNISIREGDAVRKDPLVINFGGKGAELTDTQFAFDLNADGQTENISFVAGGSGFLVLDKNRDGRVNDGGELFGPASGDGFADLSQYDQDGNQWIDENDAVYQQLQVWQRDAQGQDQLSTLAQAGVGALYLGKVASPFSVNNASTNQTLGLVRSSGLFLYESGQAGSMQQVDL
jgi:hypothetical protein